MSVVVDIQGLDKMLTLVDVPRAQAEIDRAINRAAEQLRDQAKKMPPVSGPRDGYAAMGIPVDTGRLRQSIQKRRLALMAAEIFAPVDYGIHVHDEPLVSRPVPGSSG